VDEREPAEICIGNYRGPLRDVLLGIDEADLTGAVIELDGAPSDELKALVEERTRSHPQLAEANRKAGGKVILGFSIGGGPLSLPIEGTNLREVVAMLDHHAEPEVAIGLKVVKEDVCLIDAPDVGGSEMWVSHSLSPNARKALIGALGEGLVVAPD
jgi:hypothetical protein